MCPRCQNKTYTVVNASERVFDEEVADPQHELPAVERYLTVRLIRCGNCGKPFVLGSYSYHHDDFGVWRSSFEETFAFQMPEQAPQLPESTPREVARAIKEGSFAISHRKTLSAGAMIRTAIDRLLTHEKVPETGGVEKRIELLELDDDLRADLAQLNIVGRETLHIEDYTLPELRNALLVLIEVVTEIYGKRERRAELHKAISTKASSRAKKEK